MTEDLVIRHLEEAQAHAAQMETIHSGPENRILASAIGELAAALIEARKEVLVEQTDPPSML